MNISKLIGKFQAALVLVTLALCLSTSRAQTLEIYVNPITWAFSSTGGTGWANVENFSVTSGGETRYYFAGSFDVVNVRNLNFPNAVLQTISPCNSICYIKGTNLFALTAGYNGGGNGVSGEILTLAKFSNGDLYLGGSFTLAGGYSHAGKFSCYRFSSGWSGVNEREVTGGDVTQLFSFNGYKLRVQGTFNTVHGPTSSGGSIYDSISVPSGVAYWNEWNQAFPNCYWTSN